MYETKLRATSLAAFLSVLVLAAAPAAQAADGVGMRIVRDPVTGQLRAPTADESKAMDEQEAQARAARAAAGTATSSSSAAPRKFIQSNGVRYRVGDSFMSYSVIKRGADGTLDMQCVTGKDVAEKMVQDSKSSTATSTSTVEQEHGHAHE